MNIRELQEEILKLKKENDFCILAHCYENREITEIADFVGDSFGLSQKAAEVPAKNILMCGVRFMAETVKMLSPDKHVYLSHPQAGCPMADQLDYDGLMKLREEYPDHTVVAYINTSADMKRACDVCVTSSSAVQIMKNIENDKILFVPDCNLGSFVAKQTPDKQFQFMQGGCPIHSSILPEEVLAAKKLHPNALVLVHPECVAGVAELADYVGSTTGIMDFAKNSDAKEFIIGTENSICTHLQFDVPDKKFYPLSTDFVCHNMKLTTLVDVYHCVAGDGGEEILLDETTIAEARKCIDEMLRLG